MRTPTTLEWPYLAAKWSGISPFLLACNKSGGHISRILSTKSVDSGSLLWFPNRHEEWCSRLESITDQGRFDNSQRDRYRLLLQL
uniref:Uncharacterized protein n=1 Tax=Populus trichocarpa TaxID=3694 RepID=A0A3N7G960_POPTR